MADVGKRADFSFIRYAQCWEDADVLLEALEVKPGDFCVSIASGGENSFSLLSRGAHVAAVDLSPSQLAVTALKRAAYRALDYDSFLTFVGARADRYRMRTYKQVKELLEPEHREFFNRCPELLERGIIHCGKFEDYFSLFRNKVLPLIHSQDTVDALLRGSPHRAEREQFYEKRWNNLRYRAMFQVFFSRQIMARHGRDAAFFRYVQGSVAARIKDRVRTGLIETDPGQNPYLHFILTGRYGEALPHALRRENFAAIKQNAEQLTLVEAPLEEYLAGLEDSSVAAYNLSDIFEYMSPEQMDTLYGTALDKAAPGGRFAYWNMLAPRSANPDLFGGRVRRLEEWGDSLLKRDKAFFYSRFVVEEKR